MYMPSMFLSVLAAFMAATASLSEMLLVTSPITNDIISSFDMPRSVITSLRSTTKIELSLIEAFPPDMFDIIPIIAKLKIIESTDDTIIASHAPTNEPSTTVKNFFIVFVLFFSLSRQNIHLKHKDRNFFAITARLLQKITGFCKKMPRTASFFCYAEHYMVEKLYFTTIIASITCQ